MIQYASLRGREGGRDEEGGRGGGGGSDLKNSVVSTKPCLQNNTGESSITQAHCYLKPSKQNISLDLQFKTENPNDIIHGFGEHH